MSFNFGPTSHFFWETHSVQQKGKFDSVIFVIPNIIGKDVAISGVISEILEVTVYETEVASIVKLPINDGCSRVKAKTAYK